MSSVENRIVSMQFDNAEFERKLSATLDSIAKLSKSLEFKGASQGFDGISKAASRFDLSKMASAVDHISSRFSVFGASAFAVIQNLTNSVLNFVKHVAKDDILGPIITGGTTRAKNIEQAQFMFEGLGINVAAGMKSALDAVRGTAFGLDEAAKAAAQFGASGITVGAQMTGALRGVAGAAAMTGSSFTEMADIFAGSAGSGKVNNMDLMQFATRGLNAAAAIGKVMGKTEAQIHAMAAKGTLDFKTFASAMDTAFGKHATEANKTYSGALANLHAAMSRLGASFFGDKLLQQRDLFNALSPVIDKVNKALLPFTKTLIAISSIGTKKIIGFLNKLNFDTFIKGINNVVIGVQVGYFRLAAIFKTIREAFREVFPKTAGSNFLALTEAFKNFVINFKIGGETASKLKNIFQGLFSVFAIGWEIVKELFGIFTDLIGVISPSGSGLLEFGSSVGTTLSDLKIALVEGGGIHNFFVRLGEIIVSTAKLFTRVRDAIVSFFRSVTESTAAEKALGRVDSRIQNLKNTVDTVTTFWQRTLERFKGVFVVLGQVWDYIANWFGELGSKIADAFHPGDFSAAVDVVNVGLLGGIAAMLHKFISGGFKLDFGTGLINKIRGVFDGLTDTLKAMQTSLKADALKKIAVAIALLVGSIVVLSLIDSKALTKALTALSVSFAELIGAMTLLDKLNFSTSIIKLNGIAAAMILIAGASVVLAIAIVILSRLDLGGLAKGLAGVGAGLLIMVVAVNTIGADAPAMLAAGVAMLGIATSMVILAEAVKKFSNMSWGDIAKGLVSVAVGLALITTALNFMPAEGILSGLGFIELAVGLNILAFAIAAIGKIPGGTLVKALLGIAGALLVIAATMNLMPISMPITAAGILILSGALVIMAKAVKSMGAASLGVLAKGIGAFAVMLGVIVLAMQGMTSALPGAAALLVVSMAMARLADVLIKLGGLNLKQILTGLGAMAAVLLVLAAAAALLEPLLPSMIGLGIALAAIGVGFTLIGIGVVLLARGLEILGESGAKGAKGIVEIIKTLITAVPQIEKALVMFLIHFAEDLLKAAPLLVRLIQALLEQILETIIKEMPLIVKALGVIITGFLQLVRDKFPELVATGFAMLLAFLQGARDNIGEIVTLAIEIMVNFVNGITDNIGLLVAAGATLIASFLDEISKNLGLVITAGANLIIALLYGIATNIVRIVNIVPTMITMFLTAISNNITRVIDAGANVMIKFMEGLGKRITDVITAGTNVILAFLIGLGKNAVKIANAAGQALLDFINGLTKAINTYAPQIRTATLKLAEAIIDGLTAGLASKAFKVINKAKDIAGKVLGAFGHAIGFGSPAKKFIEMGESMVNGLAIALNKDKVVTDSVGNLADNVVSTFRDTIREISTSLSDLKEFNPTITPVLDLTRVKADAGNLNKLIGDSAFTPAVSIRNARLISATADLSKADSVIHPDNAPTQVFFEQNNYSPEALSTNDIYRSTKSQIAMAKEGLGIR